ncbi:M4 family metallopeptidase [Streptomyces sp. ISL-99]|uniref:M4 family metallopeptidase n=1 Tax=Streptomyces sp. ISL-99 TaxID=2819193 RepID=UPI0020355F83|nr:M4 family metallopeptidase [Streptomyces sp. ISL-99]
MSRGGPIGKGGVDDAEDAEVVMHEYGHAVHHAQVPGFGTSVEAGSIGEAFGDYLAVTVGAHAAVKYGWPLKADVACVADWDAVSYTSTTPHCLRRIDGDKVYGDRVGQVHADGQIWSRALFDIRSELGARTADRIIVNAQFGFAPDTSFTDAALTTVATARKMYGAEVAAAVRDAFRAREIPGV